MRVRGRASRWPTTRRSPGFRRSGARCPRPSWSRAARGHRPGRPAGRPGHQHPRLAGRVRPARGRRRGVDPGLAAGRRRRAVRRTPGPRTGRRRTVGRGRPDGLRRRGAPHGPLPAHRHNGHLARGHLLHLRGHVDALPGFRLAAALPGGPGGLQRRGDQRDRRAAGPVHGRPGPHRGSRRAPAAAERGDRPGRAGTGRRAAAASRRPVSATRDSGRSRPLLLPLLVLAFSAGNGQTP